MRVTNSSKRTKHSVLIKVADAPDTIANAYGKGNTHWLIPHVITVEWEGDERPNRVTVHGPLMLKGGKPSEQQRARSRFHVHEREPFHPSTPAPDWVLDALTEVGVL